MDIWHNTHIDPNTHIFIVCVEIVFRTKRDIYDVTKTTIGNRSGAMFFWEVSSRGFDYEIWDFSIWHLLRSRIKSTW